MLRLQWPATVEQKLGDSSVGLALEVPIHGAPFHEHAMARTDDGELLLRTEPCGVRSSEFGTTQK